METIALSNATTTDQPQELCPGLLTLEMLHDRKIAVFTFPPRTKDAVMNTREVADVWMQVLKDQVQNLAAGDSWYRLHDFSTMNIPPTPYFVSKLLEASKHRPDLRGHSVFVLPRNMFTQIMQNLSYRIQSQHIRIRLFFSREEGLRWLDSEIEADKGRVGILA